MKITNLMIYMVLISLFVATIATFIADLNNNYGTQIDEDNLEVYNKLEELSSQTEEVQNKVDDLKEKSGIFDILGGLLSDAYNALKITAKSFDLLSSITNEGVEDAKLPSIFKVALSTIALIIIFIGIILSAILKDNNKL